jgi:hypothetical protein
MLIQAGNLLYYRSKKFLENLEKTMQLILSRYLVGAIVQTDGVKDIDRSCLPIGNMRVEFERHIHIFPDS